MVNKKYLKNIVREVIDEENIKNEKRRYYDVKVKCESCFDYATVKVPYGNMFHNYWLEHYHTIFERPEPAYYTDEYGNTVFVSCGRCGSKRILKYE